MEGGPMVSWGGISKQWGRARAVLGIPARGGAVHTMGKTPSPSAWRRKMEGWAVRRKEAGCGAGDPTFEEGRLLLSVLATMGEREKRAVAEGEKNSMFSLGDELLSTASRACDMPDPGWAREQTELHARFCQALGGPVGPKALRVAASTTADCAWWEVANEWGLDLCAQARGAVRRGAGAWGDVEAQSMCDELSMCASKALLGDLDGTGVDPRYAAAWIQCAKWPWPARALGTGTVEWARRKWRDSAYAGSSGKEGVFASLPEPSAWGDLAMARAGLGDSMARVGRALPSEEAAWRMRDMFDAEREADALGEEARAGAARGKGALSKAL